jgi:hypothetical protein
MGFDDTKGAVPEAGAHAHIPALEEEERFLQRQRFQV